MAAGTSLIYCVSTFRGAVIERPLYRLYCSDLKLKTERTTRLSSRVANREDAMLPPVHLLLRRFHLFSFLLRRDKNVLSHYLVFVE